MVLIPLIARELLVQSRKRSTYDARIGWGLAGVALLGFFSLNFPSQSVSGRHVLSAVHACIGIMLFVLAPIATADAISREKREGTLPLLLLTRLSPREIVLGKLAVHFFRLFYFALMMLPFMMIPVLLGGVALQDFLVSAVILLSIVVTGLSAGLLASAISVQFGVALAWAIFFSVFSSVLLSSIAANGALMFVPNNFSQNFPTVLKISALGPGLMLFPVLLKEFVFTLVIFKWVLWVMAAGLILLATLFLAFAVSVASRKVAGLGEFNGETKRQAAFRRKFLTPIVWRSAFRRAMATHLDRNPFTWLEYRTAWARAARWALVLGVVLLETHLAIQSVERNDFVSVHFIALVILVTFVTFKSSSSFQQEKQSGAFELLLVAPFTERGIVRGRLRAVAGYYAPTLVILALLALLGFGWSQRSYFETDNLSTVVNFMSICASIVSVPVVGLFFALRCRTFVGSLLWTAGLAILAPICLWTAFKGVVWILSAKHQWAMAMFVEDTFRETWWPVLMAVGIYHLAITMLSASATLARLRKREFSI